MAEHAHVVRAAAVHAALAELGPAEEVAAADHDGDLDALGAGDGDLLRDRAHHVRVDAELPRAERLAGELQEDSAAASVGHGSQPSARPAPSTRRGAAGGGAPGDSLGA